MDFSKFNLKKKKNANPIPDAVNENVRREQEYQQTQDALNKSRADKNEIQLAFSELLDKDFLTKCHRVAIKNEEMYGDHAASPEAADIPDSDGSYGYYVDENGIKRSLLKRWEKDLYILPAGYQQFIGADPETHIVDLNDYIRSIQVLQHAFKSNSAASAVAQGTDQLEPFVIDFLSNLKNALERGWAMKANASLDMIKYIQSVGHCYQDYTDAEDRQKRTDTKIEFLNEVAKQLIETIDSYYDQINAYREAEKEYSKQLKELTLAYETYKRECPKEFRDTIDRLGQKNAMATLPPTHPARKYLTQIIGAREHLMKVMMLNMALEAASLNLITLRGGIDSLVFECKKAKNSSGKEFDFNQHMRVLRKIREDNIAAINEANDRTVKHLTFLDETQSLINEAANNRQLGDAVQNAAMSLENYENMQEREELLKEKEARARIEYDNEKRRRELEKEKRKNEEERIRQEEEAELQRLEEELKNEQELIQYDFSQPVENTEKTDNRETLTALN